VARSRWYSGAVSTSHTRADERILFERQSAYQQVTLVEERDGYLALTLDDVWQFHECDEHVFHEILADTPMILAPAPRRVLILGGGDGLALRNVLRYATVEAVTLCELDPAVIEMATAVPEMLALTEDAFADPRVELVVADAQEFIVDARSRPAYDVIICDFPAATSPELEPLFRPAFYAKLAGSLAGPDTVVAVQVSQDPAGFWPVCAAVEASFAWVHPMLVNLDPGGVDDCDWADFIIASVTPRTVQRGPAGATRFMRAALVDRLRIHNRSGEVFETLELCG
jgi:spermidine synthase